MEYLEELLEKPMIQMMMSFEQRKEVLAKVEKETTADLEELAAEAEAAFMEAAVVLTAAEAVVQDTLVV